jgi:amidase/aspartyl-tRNA(Asn)/glutamyl-tRNA(Gln) amidotransferase subunit A
MNFKSITEWAELAAEDPVAWKSAITQAIGTCIGNTDTAVVSHDLSEQTFVGNGPLAGVPYVAKELFDVKGFPSHSSSVLPVVTELKAEKNSAIVERMQALGGSCVAKTQMNEFAYGLSGENPHYGNCPHPGLSGCLTGGSSSGSAHMVAAGYVPIGLGTDTGGSIRLPAAWCGLYGLRTVPEYYMDGCFPLAPSFDTVGWFTRTAEDLSIVLRAWFESNDGEIINGPLKGSAVLSEALVDTDVYKRLSEVTGSLALKAPEETAALEAMMPDCNQAFNILQSGEAYAIHREWLQSYGDLYDPAVKARILRGANWSSDEVEWALRKRSEVFAWFESYFENYDYLVMPICPRASVKLADATPDLREKTLRLTGPASLAQKPALTIPVTLLGNQTVGLQFIFKQLDAAVPLELLKLCANI